MFWWVKFSISGTCTVPEDAKSLSMQFILNICFSSPLPDGKMGELNLGTKGEHQLQSSESLKVCESQHRTLSIPNPKIPSPKCYQAQNILSADMTS